MVSNGLTLYLDAASSTSYSGSGNTWSDLSGNNNHLTLYGNPTFDSNTNGGVINFDESNDYARRNSVLNKNQYTKLIFFYPRSTTKNMVSGANDGKHALWMADTNHTIYSGHNGDDGGSWYTISYACLLYTSPSPRD